MKAKNSPHQTRTTTAPRCNYLFADSRRCRMLRHHSSDELCLFHHREFTHLKFAEDLGAELVSLGGQFQNHININLVLGKIFAAVATGRMHRRDASTLAYIAQLLLQTIADKKSTRASDRYDYRGFTSAINFRYARRKRQSTRPAPASADAGPQFTQRNEGFSQRHEGPGPRNNPANTSTPPPSDSTTTPQPANPQFPDALPDTPWLREIALERRARANQPTLPPRL
jgi:hypothetical protein